MPRHTLVPLLGLLLSFPLVASMGCRKAEKPGSPGAGGSRPAASASAAPEPRSITFRTLPARIGDRIKTVRKSSLRMDIEFWQEGAKIGSNDTERTEAFARTTEVLGLIGGTPARLRAHYDRYDLVEKRWDRPPSKGVSLAGKGYLLDATDGELAVQGEGGKPAAPGEQEALQTLHGELGKDDALVAALGERPIPIGRSVPLREKLFRALAGSVSGEFKEGTIALRAAEKRGDKEAGVFEWTGTMHSREDNGLEIDWSFRGKATIGAAPAMLLENSLEAILDVKGRISQGGRSSDLQGAGTFQDDRSVSVL